MKDDNQGPLFEADRKAPGVMVFLLLGGLIGAGAGAWLLIAVFGFDDAPGLLAGPVIAGAAIGGGLAGVLVAVALGRLARLVRAIFRSRPD
jgi:hypothetical protein